MGHDARDDADFFELQSAVQKAFSASNGAPTDWEKIVDLSASILALKAKDMVVAGYLAVGLIHCRGLDGFVIGSGVYMDLIDNYWDDLYPAKARPIGRSRAIAWWLEKTAAALKALGPVALPARQAEALCSRFEATYGILKADLEDCPSVRPVVEWIAGAGEPAGAQAAAEDVPKVLPSPLASAEIISEMQVKQTFSRIEEEARRLSSFYSARDTANPMIYRLNRLAAWITVDELPVVNEGRTLLSSPDPRLRDQLVNLGARGDFPALLKLAEDETSRFLFWLDLHRYSAQALTAMGDRFKSAAETVGQETVAFVGRMKGLETFAFSDGKPFADAQTRQWLSRIMPASAPETTVMPAAPARAPEADGMGQAMDEIAQLVRGRKTAEAASRFQARLNAGHSAREKFLCRLEFVNVLAMTRGGNMIAPQIDAILEEIDRFRLDEFDPDLALRGMTIALKACRAEPDAVSKTKPEELLSRVAKIDMVEYLKHRG